MNIIADLVNSKPDVLKTGEYAERVRKHPNPEEVEKNADQFDYWFLQIIHHLKKVHDVKRPHKTFTLDYIVDFFQNEIDDRVRSRLLRRIHSIGFENLKSTFEKINRECDDYFCETEDLFGILKRHQFSKPIPVHDEDVLCKAIQFLHISLIHINILYKKKLLLPGTLRISKAEAVDTLQPFLQEVDAVLMDL